MQPVVTFYAHILGNLHTFIFLSLLFLLLYLFTFKRYIYSFFDPFVLYIVGVSFATTDIFFMHFEKMITNEYFVGYILSQFAFMLGFFICKPIKLKSLISDTNNVSVKNNGMVDCIYVISSLFLLMSQLTTYFFVGIPILLDSRLQLYEGGSGVGMLGRVVFVTSQVTVYLLIHRIKHFSKRGLLSKTFDMMMIVFILTSFVLSGAKSSLLIIVYISFYYILTHKSIASDAQFLSKLQRQQFYLFCAAILAALLIVTVDLSKWGEGGLNVNPLLQLIIRFIHSGDAFFIAYPDNILPFLTKDNPFVVMFMDFLGMFRIIPHNELPMPLGVQLVRYYIPELYAAGPNPTMNLFGLFYFGQVGAIFYCFLVGLLFSFVRNKLFFYSLKSEVSRLVFILIALAINAIAIDVTLCVGYILNILLVFPFIYLLSYLSYYALKKQAV